MAQMAARELLGTRGLKTLLAIIRKRTRTQTRTRTWTSTTHKIAKHTEVRERLGKNVQTQTNAHIHAQHMHRRTRTHMHRRTRTYMQRRTRTHMHKAHSKNRQNIHEHEQAPLAHTVTQHACFLAQQAYRALLRKRKQTHTSAHTHKHACIRTHAWIQAQITHAYIPWASRRTQAPCRCLLWQWV